MPTPRPVDALTRAIRSGDGAALTELYESSFDELLRQARRFAGRDEAMALDLVQETFLRVIRSLPVLEAQPQLDAWLRRTLERCALDRLKREARRAQRERRHAAREAVAEVSTERGRANTLEERLAALAPHELDLLAGRFRFGWTLSRIGESLGMRSGAVDGRIQRLLGKLRLEVDDE